MQATVTEMKRYILSYPVVVISQKMTRWHGTNYLVHLSSQYDVIVAIDIEEELNGRGNGGDLDYDGENTIDFDDKMREFKLDISRVLLGDDKIEKANERGMNSVLLHVGETMDPDGVKVPKSPYY